MGKKSFLQRQQKHPSSNMEIMKSMQPLSFRLLNEIQFVPKKKSTEKNRMKNINYLLGRQFTHIEIDDAFNSPRTEHERTKKKTLCLFESGHGLPNHQNNYTTK